MVFWAVITYIAMSSFFWFLNGWLGLAWTLITGIAFYAIVIWDTRDRRRRGEIK